MATILSVLLLWNHWNTGGETCQILACATRLPPASSRSTLQPHTWSWLMQPSTHLFAIWHQSWGIRLLEHQAVERKHPFVSCCLFSQYGKYCTMQCCLHNFNFHLVSLFLPVFFLFIGLSCCFLCFSSFIRSKLKKDFTPPLSPPCWHVSSVSDGSWSFWQGKEVKLFPGQILAWMRWWIHIETFLGPSSSWSIDWVLCFIKNKYMTF